MGAECVERRPRHLGVVGQFTRLESKRAVGEEANADRTLVFLESPPKWAAPFHTSTKSIAKRGTKEGVLYL